MTRVSQQKLSEQTLHRIQEQMANVFLDLVRNKQGATFLEEFFTPAEQVMFAKRLAVVAMLTRGESYHTIADALKVSTSTVSRMDARIERGALRAVVRYVKSRKNRAYIEKCLDVLIFAHSPSMLTKERWRALDIIDDKDF